MVERTYTAVIAAENLPEIIWRNAAEFTVRRTKFLGNLL